MTEPKTDTELRFVELWNAGEKADYIASILGIARSTVSEWRNRFGLAPRQTSQTKYSDEQMAMLKRLWCEEGLSATEIAPRMGRGWTRNMVIGQVNRRGFNAGTRKTPARPARLARPPKAPKAKTTPIRFNLSKSKTDSTPEQRAEKAAEGRAAIAKVEAANVGSPNARPFLEHKTGCKWPIGAGMSMLYCCNPTVGGTGAAKVYCSEHHKVAVSSVQPYRPRSPVSSFTRHDRIATPRPKPANDPFGSAWDDERAVA